MPSQDVELTLTSSHAIHSHLQPPTARDNTDVSTSPTPSSTPSFTSVESNGLLDAQAKQHVKLAYLDYYKQLCSSWKDIPDLTITYSDVSFTVPISVEAEHIPSLGTAMFHRFTPKQKKPFHALHKVSGTIRPGTMTLILAPPGHGKSLFLKALANKLDGSPYKSGEVLYNGETSTQALAHGIYVSRLLNYVDQHDIHMPLLTVRETFQFALDNAVPDPALLNDTKLMELHKNQVNAVIELLGLKECEDTIVGNAVLRGISGGQKKRVTLGEFLVGNARALFLDEISTGLDAAAAFDITSALRRWSRLMNGSIVAALLQPAPEVYEMFDDIILMREGCVLYHGPRSDVMPYLYRSFGIQCPSDQDEADFIIEFLTDPLKCARQQMIKQHRTIQKIHVATQPMEQEIEISQVRWHTDAAESASLPKSGDHVMEYKFDDIHKADEGQFHTPVRDLSLMYTHAMVEIWNKSSAATSIHDISKTQPIDVNKLSAYSRAQYASSFPRSLFHHTYLNLHRQCLLLSRNKNYLRPRLFQPIMMGLVLGSLYHNLGICDFYNRLGLIQFATMFGGFSNMPELPIAVEARQVVTKQTTAGFYSTFSYIFSVILMHVPLAAAETFLLSIILYFMASFTQDAGRFFFFWLCMFSSNMAISVFYRMLAYLAPKPEVANQMAGPTTAVFLQFGGFLITYEKIPNFMQWLYWLSPFSWVVKSFAQNEFFADRYTVLPNSVSCATRPPSYPFPTVDLGLNFLQSFQFPTDTAYKWGGIGYLYGWFILFSICSALVLKYKVIERITGTKRIEESDQHEAMIARQMSERVKQITMNVTPVDGIAKESFDIDSSIIMVGGTSAASALPFEPVTLAFTHIHYTVKVDKDGKKNVDRKLIDDVSGYAKPGTLTALMGSSGAGKTTLMDVIAGRKNAGKIEGQILVNGYPKHDETFSRVTGYVEQNDVHTPTDTVREALMFSARLRLPASVTDQQRIAFVDEVLHILELDKLADRMIGDDISPGLSAGQLKRVTIGVELVANPSVLFLDEPTSGLDSRAALVVMRVIKRIAMTGRSVVCTIHQPSAELFYMFDRLLLLKTGGKQVFFGDIGHQGCELVHYFEMIEGPNSPKKPHDANPAAWMLDVIGAGVLTSNRIVDHAALYATSTLHKQSTIEIEQACQPSAISKQLHFDSRYARSLFYQWFSVQFRFYRFYWRNVPFNMTRFFILSFLGLLNGLVYLQLRVDDYAGVNTKLAVMAMTAAFNGVIHAATSIPVLIRQRAVFYREKASDTYSPIVYSSSLALVEIPYVAFASMLFLCCFYFLAGFPLDAHLFFQYYMFHFLLSLTFSYIGQLISAVVPNLTIANILMGLIFVFAFLLNGVFVRPKDIPKGWIWVYYINPIPKCLIGMVATQLECIEHADNTTSGYGCGYIRDPASPSTSSQIRIDHYVQNQLEFGYDSKFNMVGWLVLTMCVIRFMVAVAIKKVSHVRR